MNYKATFEMPDGTERVFTAKRASWSGARQWFKQMERANPGFVQSELQVID